MLLQVDSGERWALVEGEGVAALRGEHRWLASRAPCSDVRWLSPLVRKQGPVSPAAGLQPMRRLFHPITDADIAFFLCKLWNRLHEPDPACTMLVAQRLMIRGLTSIYTAAEKR